MIKAQAVADAAVSLLSIDWQEQIVRDLGTAPKKLYRIKRHPHAQHMNGGESYEKYSRKGNSTKKVLS
ncbi:hypothetical protein FACS1894184_18370 [Clostridia bacterium]|nr:hypothetical protein FACS1894184_18370 [Clostridia bacterium]